MNKDAFEYLFKKGYKFERVSHNCAERVASDGGAEEFHASPESCESIFKENLKTIADTLSTYSRWFDRSILKLSSEEYRRDFWREASRHGYTIGPMPRTYKSVMRSLGMTTMGEASAAFWVELARCSGFPLWYFGMVVTPKLCRQLFADDRKIFNTEKERLRRLQLRADRMAVKIRRTVNPMPSLQSIREAYEVVRNLRKHPEIKPSDAGLRLGFLLEDLERYVDNHVLSTPGTFGACGRAGGIKRLLEREAPDLFEHYAAIMRYKAIAKRFRQGCGAEDPISVKALVSDTQSKDVNVEGKTSDGNDFPPDEVLRDCARLNDWMSGHGNTEYLKTQSWVPKAEIVYTDKHILHERALKAAEEMLAFCDGSMVSLQAAIALKIDPDCIVSNAEAADGLKSKKLPQRIKNWICGKHAKRTCVA